ncbi:hypothetical protein [Clostridium sp.]|uniref:hypothetical protein n=1 Tax=Clostridium sp. TaxID=1506 RepID=UPI00346453D6
MELVKYEIYKIFSRKSIYVVFLLFIVMFSGEVISDSAYNNDKFGSKDTIIKEYVKLEGDIKEDRIRDSKEYVKSMVRDKKVDRIDYSDYNPEESLKLKIYKDYAFQGRETYTTIQGEWDEIYTLSSVEENINKLKEDGEENSFKYRENLKIKDLLNNIEDDEFNYLGSWESLITSFTGTAAIIGILLILGLSEIFSGEDISNMNLLILSSRHGRKKSIFSKLGAAALYSLIVFLAVTIFSMMVPIILNGLNNGDTASLRDIGEFTSSPYEISVAKYYLFANIFRFIVILAFAIIVTFISSLTKKPMMTMFISLVILSYGDIIIAFKILRESFISVLGYLSPLKLMQVNIVFREFKAFNIFGYPVLYPVMAIIAMIVVILICTSLSYYKVKNREA